MKVREIMTLGAITVSPDATIAEAASLMLRHRISGLPVMSDLKPLAGIVTEGDLMRCADTRSGRDRPGWLIFLFGAGKSAEQDARLHAQTVKEVMTRDVIAVRPGSPVEEAVDLMEGLGLKRLPVVRGGRPVGIVSRSDLLRPLAQRSRDETPDEEDRAIRIQVLRELEDLIWTSPTSVQLDVCGGVAHLTGTVGDRPMKRRMLAAVHSVVDVRKVQDRLVLVLDSSPEAEASAALVSVQFPVSADHG